MHICNKISKNWCFTCVSTAWYCIMQDAALNIYFQHPDLELNDCCCYFTWGLVRCTPNPYTTSSHKSVSSMILWRLFKNKSPPPEICITFNHQMLRWFSIIIIIIIIIIIFRSVEIGWNSKRASSPWRGDGQCECRHWGSWVFGNASPEISGDFSGFLDKTNRILMINTAPNQLGYT